MKKARGENQKYGIVGDNDEVILPFEYDDIGISEYFHARYVSWPMPVKKGTKWGFVNENNEIVIGFIYDDAMQFHDGYAKVKMDKHWGCIDLEGNMAVPCRFDYIGRMKRGLFPVQYYENGKTGYYKPNAGMLIACVLDEEASTVANTIHFKYKGKDYILEEYEQQCEIQTEISHGKESVLKNIINWFKGIFIKLYHEIRDDFLSFAFISLFVCGVASVFIQGIYNNIKDAKESKIEAAIIEKASKEVEESEELRERLIKHTKKELVDYIIYEWKKDSVSFELKYGESYREAKERIKYIEEKARECGIDY